MGKLPPEIRQVDSDRDGVTRPPSIAEWEDSSCGSFTSEEQSAFNKLVDKNPKSSVEEAGSSTLPFYNP